MLAEVDEQRHLRGVSHRRTALHSARPVAKIMGGGSVVGQRFDMGAETRGSLRTKTSGSNEGSAV